MNKKTAKRQRDLKTKLMAAVAMLLVSSLMMVTSTYAWFTLSTAPEVTGIQTAVGANGNLEMALLPADGATTGIFSEAGDSNKVLKDKNITWGNLVDLSDNTVYGLDKITLFPSALNLGTDGAMMTSAPLKFPQYGADGRISELVANTVTAVYGESGTFIPDANTTYYGVRAVGSASGMTERQLAYRNARDLAGSAMSSAAKLAAQSLDRNGDALAAIAVKKGTESDPKFNQSEVDSLKSIVDDLDAVFAEIETSYKQYILAAAASAVVNEDAAWLAVKGFVEASGATLADVVTNLTTNGTYSLPEAIQNGITKYNLMVESVNGTGGAADLLDGLGTKTEYTWNEIQPILAKLANPDNMKINGFAASDVKEHLNDLVASVSRGEGINVTISSGGGVYADIADQTTNFTADVTIQQIVYSGAPFGPFDAKMKTAGMDPSYLDLVGAMVIAAGAPAGGETGDLPISDMYGYIIDMAFRTNAASSNLMLQQEAADRIYSSNENGVALEETPNVSTMGNGSNMTFKSLNVSFSNEKVIKLMEAVCIVFFDPDSGNIVKYAKLDTSTDNVEIAVDGSVKANLMLYDMSNGESQTVYYTDIQIIGSVSYTYYYTDNTKTTPFCRSYTEGETEKWQTYTAGAEGAEGTWTDVGAKPENIPSETVTGTNTLVPAADQTIMALAQNAPVKLSVLVYLDGNKVTNAEVASSGAQSVVGQLNLQFASDANLTPMDYTPLMEQGSTATEGNENTETP